MSQAALRYKLGDEYQFDFIEGSYPWPAAPGIKRTFGSHICYSYHDGTPTSIMTALNDFAEYITENGPFDAVIGFSLGAALVATFLLYPMWHPSAQSQIKSAIFICGTLPCDCDALAGGVFCLIRAKDVVDKALITIPTIHAWSQEDREYPGQSEELVKMCQRGNRIELTHEAGHAIPSQGDEIAAIEKAIRESLAGLPK